MSCTAHRFHKPAQPASDSHHVIPRAWQAFLRPSNPLWDKRTVELCPNCHRGVHERIVELMHQRPKGRDRLWPIAQLALDRYETAGGSLDLLRKHRLWGEQ